MKRYRAAVVGLGAIGLGFDADAPPGERVQTHSRAFSEHPGFELVAGADPAPEARSRFTARYGAHAYATLDALLAVQQVDVIAIAAGTSAHRGLVERSVAARPRAILCEKPLAPDARDGVAMVEAAAREGVLLAVNYNRRFDPGIAELRARLDAGEFGEIRKGVVWYAKGLANNGSHYLDLLDHLLGEARDPRLVRPGRRLANGDIEPDFVVHFGDAPVYFLAGRHEDYSHGGFDLFGSKGRIQYDAGGRDVRTWLGAQDAEFSGYVTLRETPNLARNDVERYQWHVACALHAALESGMPPVSTGASALRSLRLVDALNMEIPAR